MSDADRQEAMLRECRARLETAQTVIAAQKAMIETRDRLLLRGLRHLKGSMIVDTDRLVADISEVLRP